jgi:hypothetical protein
MAVEQVDPRRAHPHQQFAVPDRRHLDVAHRENLRRTILFVMDRLHRVSFMDR